MRAIKIANIVAKSTPRAINTLSDYENDEIRTPPCTGWGSLILD